MTPYDQTRREIDKRITTPSWISKINLHWPKTCIKFTLPQKYLLYSSICLNKTLWYTSLGEIQVFSDYKTSGSDRDVQYKHGLVTVS